MIENVVRKFLPEWRIIAIGAVLTAAGCGTKPSSDYRTYSEMEKKQSSLSAESPADKPSSHGPVGNKIATISPDGGILPPRGEPKSQLPAASATKGENLSAVAAKAIEDKISVPAEGEENRGGQSVALAAGSTGDAGTKQKSPFEEAKSPARPSTADSGTGSPQKAVAIAQNRSENTLTKVIASGRLPVTARRPGQDESVTSATTVARKVQLLVPTKEFKTEGPDGAIRVSYDDIDLLKVLNMEPVTPNAPKLMPSWLKGLDGKRIRIRGFMYPTFQETGLRGFVLARDNQICCFGRNPKIYDIFSVALRPGVTTDYIQNRPFDVVGVFHIRPEEAEGELFNLYEMDDARVIDK